MLQQVQRAVQRAVRRASPAELVFAVVGAVLGIVIGTWLVKKRREGLSCAQQQWYKCRGCCRKYPAKEGKKRCKKVCATCRGCNGVSSKASGTGGKSAVQRVAEAVFGKPKPKQKTRGGGGWRKALLTCFDDAQFANEGADSSDTIAVHEKDWGALSGKQLVVRTSDGNENTFTVNDYCNKNQEDCIRNVRKHNFIIDIHRNALDRLGRSSGSCENTSETVEFKRA